MLSKSEMLDKYTELETCIDNRFGKRLIGFLTVKELKTIGMQVKEEYIDTWEVKKEWTEENIIKELISDAEFGLQKAENERGISSSLMTEVCQAWLTVLEDDSIIAPDENYNYDFFEEILLKYKEPSKNDDMGLLEEIRHNLVSLHGLKAFDSLSENTKSNDSHVTIPISELIPLDFTELIKKVDKELE